MTDDTWADDILGIGLVAAIAEFTHTGTDDEDREFEKLQHAGPVFERAIMKVYPTGPYSKRGKTQEGANGTC